MTKAPKTGHEIEDHHVHNASPFVTKVLRRFSRLSNEESEP